MMDEELTKMLKYLRLSGLLANWDHFPDIAAKGKFSHIRLLRSISHVINMKNCVSLRPKLTVK